MSNLATYLSLVKTRPELFHNPHGAAFEILLREAEIQQAEKSVAESLRKAGAPTEWAEVGIAFQDQYVLILRDAVRYTDGSLGTYIRMVDPLPGVVGVVVFPVWNEQVLLINHFRHATRRWHLEIPRGFGLSADPLDDATRELQEEVGARGASLTSLGMVYPDTGTAESRVAFFYAEVSHFGNPELVEGISEIRPTSISEFERMVRDGELEDGYLLTAYGLAKAKNLI